MDGGTPGQHSEASSEEEWDDGDYASEDDNDHQKTTMDFINKKNA